MFIVLRKFVIANDMIEAVKTAFRNRSHQVENAIGFIRLEVISPCEKPQEIWLMTYWQDKHSYEQWHQNCQAGQRQLNIPKGLKLLPEETELRFFDYICS